MIKRYHYLMIKKIFVLFAFLLVPPVIAGQFEDAMATNENVFLYIYTPQCGYCMKFSQNYRRLISAYGQKCKFVKINGETPYGVNLATKLRANYVPFVALINSKANKGEIISSDCLLEYSCVSNKVNLFIK